MQNKKEIIKTRILDSIKLKRLLIENQQIIEVINTIVTVCLKALKKKNKILFCGNGGSAADAQHLASELSGRFYIDREPVNAEALHVNTSYITAVANDLNFSQVYARALKAKAKKGDILIGLSTSGKSPNIIEAFKTANEMDVITVGLIGQNRNELYSLSNYIISIPSKETPRVQECHMLIGHVICELIEAELFN